MEKTTVYLTREQKDALETAARATGRSEAGVIRDGIAVVTATLRAAEARAELKPSDVETSGRREAGTSRPRWLAREEFARRLRAHSADAGLRAELRELAPGTTVDEEIG